MALDMQLQSPEASMRKGLVLLVVGTAITLTTTLHAADRPIIAVGCVNRAAQSGSMTATAVAPPATSDTAGTIANTATLTNEFMLNGATSPEATDAARAAAAAGLATTSPGAPVSYVLDVRRSQIEPHVGHRIEVTGTLLPLAGTTPAAPSALKGDAESRVQHIRVTSVRMLADSCNAGAPESK
jgi:hypothetical protein